MKKLKEIHPLKILKNLENDCKFNENSVNETTGEKKTFFNLGPNNNWKKILKKEIETQFNNEMKEFINDYLVSFIS